MKKTMKEYKTQTKKLYPIPQSVQHLIPIYAVAEDGIFQLEDAPPDIEKQYDKAYLFANANFTTRDDLEKEDFLKQYCMLLNSLGVSFKVVIMNNNRNMKQVRAEVFLEAAKNGYQDLVSAINRQMEDAMLYKRGGIEEARIFILSCKCLNVERARDYFRSIEANLQVAFQRMESALLPLDAKNRLKYLHAFYRMGEEDTFSFDFSHAVCHKRDFKDVIAPRMIKYHEDAYGDLDGTTLQVDGRFVRCFYLPHFPNSINPDSLGKLTGGNFHILLTIDASAIPTEVVRKRLMELYMQNGRAIGKQQETLNKAGAWSSEVAYERRREREELESYLDILHENDEKMFYAGLYVVLSADSKEELDNQATSFLSLAEGEGFSFVPAIWEQLEVLNTALPTGARFCSVMYPLFTQPLAALTPFTVHELYEPGGIFYGVNQVSKNAVIGDRKNLMNGHGFKLGVTGSGKGVAMKTEIAQVYYTTKDKIIVLDLMNHEYKPLGDVLGAEYIDFDSGSEHHINPLDASTYAYMASKKAFLADKTELIIGMFSQIMDVELESAHKSIIGRCIGALYLDLDKKGFVSPTLADLYEMLFRQAEEQAKELALSMELFTNGTLDMFAKPTNVNTRKRMVIYGLSSLGKEQAGVGMMFLLESIRSTIAENAKKGIATWLFIDEFHNLASNEISAGFLEKIWKEVRKEGGICTGATQNIQDIMVSKTVQTMLVNSEYIQLLNQKDAELELLKHALGLSEHMLQYVHNVPSGCGLLKFGNKYIPIDGRIPKESAMYQLFNTNFHEIQAFKKKQIKREASDMKSAFKQ